MKRKFVAAIFTGFVLLAVNILVAGARPKLLDTATPAAQQATTIGQAAQKTDKFLSGPGIYLDPRYGYQLELPPGWLIYPTDPGALIGTALLCNYDPQEIEDRQLKHPEDALCLQLGVGALADNETFEHWLLTRRAFEMSEKYSGGRPARTSPISRISLGANEGGAFLLRTVEETDVLEINFPSGRYVLSIAIGPTNSPALPEALGIVEALQMMPPGEDLKAPPMTYEPGELPIESLGPDALGPGFLVTFELLTEWQAFIEASRVDMEPNSSSSSSCSGAGRFDMGEAPTSPISLWVPFRNGETWIVGGSGSFYGNYAHGNCQNDYYATDWNRADDYNAEVLPAAPGDLTYATSPCLSTALGCYVQVTHANDIKTTYGHLSQIYQNSGKAELGKRIGAVGSTGCIANDPPCSPHLHLGFHKLADGIYSSRCNSGINGGKCPNGESPRSPQTPRPSPINTSSGSSALKDGDSYTSNNTSGSDPGSNCPNVSYNGVILYRDKDCRGGEKSFDNVTGWVNLPDFNDDASSIYVKSGWSARVYEHASYDQGGGRHRCINGSMWDLTKDYYPDSSTKIDGTISSVQVFKNGSCSSDPPSSCPDGQFKAEYYDGRSFNNLVFARCENSINYDWGGGGPGNGLGNDEFSVRWTGRFGFDGGTKRFIARADDGIKVYLDGTTIIDGWKDQAPTSYTNERTPSAGTHEVKVEYYEKGGGAVAQFRWENVATSISCPDGQFKAEYFNGRTLSGGPIYARCEDRVNYDWGGGGPGNGVPNDNFSVRWTGRFNFDGGTKRFIARADDGIRVYLDGSLIINEWRDQGATEYRAERTPSAGTREVKVEYYENGGGAVAQVRWENVATNITCPDGQFKAEYYNASSSSAVYARCENSINYDWGGGGPGNGVNNDNFAVRWTGRFGFDGGTKRFIARADDGIKVYLDGTIIIDGWKDQAPTSYTNERTPSAGTHEVKVEYYEKGGGAVAQFRWENVATSISCPNQYKAEYWSNRYMSGNPVLVRCENWPLNNDWGNGGPGGGVPNDGFSARWTTQAAINQGTYTFIARADDGIKVYLDGSTIIDGWKDQGATEYRTTRSLNGGNYTIRIDYYENGGGAVAQFRWEAAITSGGNMALNRPAYASSQESSTYSPSKANDGSNSTRWSSMISATLGEEIWFADLGSQRSFNRVRINWEAAYAATYLVVWSDDGDTWYCFCDTVYTRGSSGWAEHNFDTRTRRYVGVIMLTRAPKMNNYSFYEFEVYGPAAATNPAGAEGAPVETTVPEMIEKEIDLPPQD